MPSNQKSVLFNLGLILTILFILGINLFIFISGPVQKLASERDTALKRVEENFKIVTAVSLYDSNYNQTLFIGEGRKEGVDVYFAATLNGNVLGWIASSTVDFDEALASAGQKTEYIDPLVRLAYYKGEFVIAILEKRRETLLDIQDYSVVFTVEINV